MNHSTLTHRRYPSVSFGSTRTQSFIGRCRPDPKYSPTKVLRRYVNVSRFVPGQFKNAVATDALPLRSPFIELSGLNAIGENGRLRRDGTYLDLGTRGLFASVVSATVRKQLRPALSVQRSHATTFVRSAKPDSKSEDSGKTVGRNHINASLRSNLCQWFLPKRRCSPGGSLSYLTLPPYALTVMVRSLRVASSG